jgi:hypothetical protein
MQVPSDLRVQDQYIDQLQPTRRQERRHAVGVGCHQSTDTSASRYNTFQAGRFDPEQSVPFELLDEKFRGRVGSIRIEHRNSRKIPNQARHLGGL